MKVGCNYWASHAGTRMWEDWREEVVRRDFELMASAGMEVVRVFPNWRDFQPLEMIHGWSNTDVELLLRGRPLGGEGCGSDGVDERQVSRFRWMCGVAHDLGLELIVSLVTGWMSGEMYVPSAFAGRNLISDPLVLKWEVRYVRRLVRELKAQPAIIMWELGNECNCMSQVASEAEAWNWTYMLTSGIRLEDGSRPVASGMHGLTGGSASEFEGGKAWTCQGQGELCDYLTAHPYPHTTSKAPARLDSHGGIRLGLQAALECRLYGDFGHRPCFVEELGTFSSSYCDDGTKSEFLWNSMFNAWAHGSEYYLWWCAFEHSGLDYPPYTWSTWERELGMYDESFGLRPSGEALRGFRRYLGSLPVRSLPLFRRNAVCVLSRCQDAQKLLTNSWSSFVLAKESGFDLSFHWIGEGLPASDLYLVPGISGTTWSRSYEYRQLLEAARAGATVYLSLDGGDLAPFSPEIFGASVVSRETREPSRVAFRCFDQSYAVTAPYRLILEERGCEVLAREENGNPIFLRNRYGKGTVYLLTVPLERHLGCTPRVFGAGAASDWARFYDEVGAVARGQRLLLSHHREVTLTEHWVSSDQVWCVAVNNSGVPVLPSWELRDGWSLCRGGGASIPAHRGLLLELRRSASEARVL